MIFQLENVSVLRSGKEILHGVSCAVRPATLTFLTGLNGSGKSTLLQAMTGMLPFSGSISFLGRPLSYWTGKAFAQEVAVIHQLQSHPFDFKVRDFIFLGRFPRLGVWGQYHTRDKEIMEASAEIAGVKDFLDRNLPSLSGGELQKVYVAQALAQDTPVLVMDEPSRFLDPLNRLRFYQLLQDLTARGKTIVCVSHDAEIFEIPQARFLGLREGALVWDGVLEEMGVRAFREEVYQLRS